ncbi:MAG: T9SS type A sorting domain-containing protein [Chitinophagales bacterium]
MQKIITLLLLNLIAYATFSQSGSETFTSSGTYTVPEGITLISIDVIGAGGTGGINGGGGGGGGGYASGVYSVTPFSILTVTIGEGGNGSIAGTSSVDAFISASGGENGFSVSNPNLGGGGAGGVGINGTIVNRTGGTGGGGYWTYFGGGGGGAAGSAGDGLTGGNTIVWNGANCLTPGGVGGGNGGVPGGSGGKGAGFTDAFCSVSNPAEDGLNYGGGGGGGNGNGGGPAAGAGGYCKISFCLLDVSTTVTDATITVNNSFSNFKWIDCNNGNLPIPGANGPSYTATQNGSYAVIVSNEICSDTSDCVDILNTGLSNTPKDAFEVYPTTFTNYIHIQHATGHEKFELLSTTGQLVWSGKHVEQQDFSELAAGWYFLNVKNEEGKQSIKLMKQ